MGNHWTSKWRLQPVRRCCKGSQPGRVAPALRNNKMKITKSQLRNIIKEELDRALSEAESQSSAEQQALAMLLARHGQALSADPERRQATINMMLDVIRAMGAEKALAQLGASSAPDYGEVDTQAQLKRGNY